MYVSAVSLGTMTFGGARHWLYSQFGSPGQAEADRLVGTVRYIGCANLAAWQTGQALGMSALHDFSAFVSAQVNYSLVSREVKRDILPMARAQRLAVTVWSPLAGGFRTGKIDRHSPTAPGRRETGGDFPPVKRELAYDIIDVARDIADRHDATAPQVAIAWLQAQPGVTSDDLGQLNAVSALAPSYPQWIQDMFAHMRVPA